MADIWSNGNMAAFLALTAHWISSDKSSRCLSLKAALIGFHQLEMTHMGLNIAKTILFLLDWAGIMHKAFISFVFVPYVNPCFKLVTSLSTTPQTMQWQWKSFTPSWTNAG
jgi:hypothetical protein